MEPDMARTRASIKKAHQLLQPTAPLADMLAVAPLAKLLSDVAAGREAKLRKQRKNRQAQAARATRVEVCS
jgi:hypothetical protein